MKKFFVMLLCLTMLLSIALPSYAKQSEDNGTYAITINNNPRLPAMFEGQFSAYQLFAGEISGGLLVNIEWGSGIDADDFLTALTESDNEEVAAAFADLTADDVRQVVDILSKKSDENDHAFLQAFAEAASLAISFDNDNYVTSIIKNGDSYMAVDAPGYYLVVENSTHDIVVSEFVMCVVDGTAEANIKADVPTIEKEVFEVNDSIDAEGKWMKAADMDISDEVNYRLIGTLPNNYDSYETYTYKFIDAMSSGLTCNVGSVRVYIDDNLDDTDNGEDITEYFTAGMSSGSEESGTMILTVSCDNLKEIKHLTKDSKIVVIYQAELSEVHMFDRINDVYIEYSNNPRESSETGNSAKSVTIVYTYSLQLHKFDITDNNRAMEGVGFTLYKKCADEGNTDVNDDGWAPVAVNEYTDGAGNITFDGLDAGEYYLEESTPPEGYNKIGDIYFEIKSTLSEDGVDELTIEYITEENGGWTFSAEKTTGVISLSVPNSKGSDLPITGGMGVYLFYGIGGACLMSAVVYLVVAKRKKGEAK